MINKELFKALNEPVMIQYTKFENLDSDGNIEDVNYGFRVYDDYDCYIYCNIFPTFEELKRYVNESTVVKYIETNYPEVILSIKHYPISFNGKLIK